MSLEFLEILETRVRETADRLEELAAENARLKKEVEKLERDKSASAKSVRSADAAEKIEKAWARERDEIRKRTEALAEKLSALLASAPEAS